MKRIFLILLLGAVPRLIATPALLSIGGGYWDAGSHHSGGVFQVEYKWNRCFWRVIRPQIECITPNFNSLFVGIGIAFEFYVSDHIVFSPNFSPGVYFRGTGRNLGFPIEFRSALELAYEFENETRFGGQFYHISNAHLGSHNPGANALTVFFAIPL